MLSFFRYLNFFSLDVVTLGLIWQELIARVGGTSLQWNERALLGISVWIIYLTDHLFDSLNPHANQAARHCFIVKHQTLFFFLVLIALLVDAFLAFQLPKTFFLIGILVAAATFFYLVLNASLIAHGYWFRGRELIIAFIFSLGCALVPLLKSEQLATVIYSTLFFGILCMINATLIARLERGVIGDALLEPLSKKNIQRVRVIMLLLLMTGFFYHAPFAKALFISLLGLLMIPALAKKYDNEVASLAVDGALIVGGGVALM